MMLKTSSNNKNSALGLLLFTIRQNIGLIILTTIALLTVCPGYTLIRLGEIHENLSKPTYCGNEFLIIFCVVLTIASAIGIVVYNILNLNYLYSKKASDVFHALPLNRTGLLLSRCLASIASILIPLLIGYISVLLICVLTPWLIVELKILAIGFLYNILIMLVAWSISLIFIVCSGTILDFIISCSIINGGLLILPAIFDTLANEFLLGFSGTSQAAVKTMSPIYFCGFSFADFVERAFTHEPGKLSIEKAPLFTGNEWVMLIVSVILIALLTAASLFLYNRRNAERAENAYAFKFIYVISNFILSFIVGFGVGVIFAESEFNPIFYIFGIIGALLASVSYGAITDRGFKYFKKSLIIGAVSAFALITTCFLFVIDITGFEKNVPKSDEILSIEAETAGFTTLCNYDFDTVLNVHKKITKNLDDLKTNNYFEQDGETVTSFYVKYHLKNGSTVERQYWGLPVSIYGEELVEICKHEDVNTIKTQVNAERPKLVFFDGYSNLTETYINLAVPREEFIELLEIYDAENDNMTTEIFKENYNFTSNWDGNNDNYFSFCAEKGYTKFLAKVEELTEKYSISSEEEQELYYKD